MNVTIEKMTLKHLEEIKEDLKKDFDEFWNANVLKSELENRLSTYIVAIDEQNKVVGYAGIWKPTEDEAHITNIVTRKENRQNKVATKMLEELIKIAKSQKLKTITLEVNVKNTPAIHLYQKYQFEQVGIRKKYYSNCDDALIMTCKL